MGCSSSKQTTVTTNGNRPQSAHKQDQANTKMAPTAEDLKLVKDTWALVAVDMKKHGATLFLRYFALDVLRPLIN